MNIWFKLSPEEAEDYQVPDVVAQEPANSFYSTTPLNNLYHDGPWLLLTFQKMVERPSVITFQPCTVKFDFINEIDSFDPLVAKEGGQLSLIPEELDGLVELLNTYATQMPNGQFRDYNTFEQITPDQWENFHIYAPPSQAARQRVYLQLHDPIVDLREESLVSLVIVTTPPVGAVSRGFRRPAKRQVNIAFRQFSLAQLADPLFSPLEQAVSRIELDRYGLLELAMLLQTAMNDAVQFPFGSDFNQTAVITKQDDLPTHFFSRSPQPVPAVVNQWA